MSFEKRLKELGLSIPDTLLPPPNVVLAVQTGNLIYVSGQIPAISGQLTMKGKLGRDISIEQGQDGARLALLNCLAEVRSITGTLDAITRVVKVNGYVASEEGFVAQPLVMNGASLLLEEIFGDVGKHARAAIGVAELPGGAPVEIELIVEVQTK